MSAARAAFATSTSCSILVPPAVPTPITSPSMNVKNFSSLHKARRRYTRSSDSGFDVTFHFCGDCGSTVFWEPQRKPEWIAVAVGAFADPTFPRPSQAVFEGTQGIAKLTDT